MEHSKNMIREIYILATQDYGQFWLVLNQFPSNKHHVINFNILYKQCDLKFNQDITIVFCLYTVCTYCYVTNQWLAEAFNVTVFKSVLLNFFY